VTHTIKWNYQYFQTVGVVAGDEYKNKKIPGQLHQDPNDRSRMYLFGQFNQRASIIKFSKSNMNVDYKLEIKDATGAVAPASEMHEIYSYIQPANDESIYTCGYKWENPTEETYRKAVTMKMSTSGDVQMLNVWGESSNYDVCRAVSHDKTRREIAFLLEVTSPSLRPSYSKYSRFSGDNSDIMIIVMRESGAIVEGFNINMDTASISLGVGDHSFFIKDEYYIFGGQSYGFKTKAQNKTYDIIAPEYDSYVFKHNPRTSLNCLYGDSMSRSQLSQSSINMAYSGSQVEDISTNRGLFRKMNLFMGYTSRYSGSFDLGDTIKYPKMCADKSENMTDGVEYYRGQRELGYNIGANSKSGSVVMADVTQTWMFQNGTAADGLLGRWDPFVKQGTIFVQTDAQEAEGKRRTILRGCNRFDNLNELYLYVNVLKNTYPDFKTEIETSWTLSVGDNFSYKLPQLVDDEGNDIPEVYIEKMDNQEFPPFLYYDNNTQTLTFTPHSIWYQGITYYFIIVVKEQNSDSVFYPYYCTVKMSGVKIDPEEYLNFTDISFSMGPIDRESKGTLIWSAPVNTTFVKEHFDTMFDVYIKNVTFRVHNQTMYLKDFKILELDDDQMTMNYQAEFYEPYKLGLLMKKSDKLYIHLKYDLLDTKGYFRPEYRYLDGMVLGNKTLTRMYHEECMKDLEAETSSVYGSTTNREKLLANKRIDMQFDFRNTEMYYMRQLAIKMYFYICGIVFLQFFILLWRNVGLLPVWTMIEYMQLVSFIPLYNFRMIPYLYDAFKPFLVSHLVLTNETFILTDMQDDFFNINYDYYWLNVAKLGQALALITVGAFFLVFLNLCFFIAYKTVDANTKTGKWVAYNLSQFKFNVYIRYYMLSYFDLTFFSVMKLVEGNDSTQSRRIATMFSYVLFTLAIVVPTFLMFIVCKRFEVMKIKQAKASFNTLVLKIDKQSRWRLIQPGYFFFRRLLTAVLLAMPIDNTFIFLQYVFILMSSHAYVLYLVAIKPYQSPLLNNYVLSNETFYSALIIAIFIFSDATPELNIKMAAGVVLITSIFLLIFANFVMIIVLICKGRDKLKDDIRESKLKRAEKELMEEEEEEERRQRQKKEEEEFTRLPEDTTNMSHYDMNGTTNPAMLDSQSAMNPSTKKSKKSKKNKNNNDDVEDMTVGVGASDFAGSEATKGKKSKDGKKKKKKDKNKNKQDDLHEAGVDENEVQIDGPVTDGKDKGKKTKGSTDDPSGNSSSDKKKKKSKKGSEPTKQGDKDLF